jgi:hypothetical protein
MLNKFFWAREFDFVPSHVPNLFHMCPFSPTLLAYITGSHGKGSYHF